MATGVVKQARSATAGDGAAAETTKRPAVFGDW